MNINFLLLRKALSTIMFATLLLAFVSSCGKPISESTLLGTDLDASATDSATLLQFTDFDQSVCESKRDEKGEKAFFSTNSSQDLYYIISDKDTEDRPNMLYATLTKPVNHPKKKEEKVSNETPGEALDRISKKVGKFISRARPYIGLSKSKWQVAEEKRATEVFFDTTPQHVKSPWIALNIDNQNYYPEKYSYIELQSDSPLLAGKKTEKHLRYYVAVGHMAVKNAPHTLIHPFALVTVGNSKASEAERYKFVQYYVNHDKGGYLFKRNASLPYEAHYDLKTFGGCYSKGQIHMPNVTSAVDVSIYDVNNSIKPKSSGLFKFPWRVEHNKEKTQPNGWNQNQAKPTKPKLGPGVETQNDPTDADDKQQQKDSYTQPSAPASGGGTYF